MITTLASGPQLEIRLLGQFSVRRDGREIPAPALGGRLGRALVRILVTRRGTVVPVDVLAEALWPDRQPADPAANVAVLLSRVRRALEEPTLIAAVSGGYLFAVGERCVVDAQVFLDNAERGRVALAAGRAEDALREFRAALESWRGEPLPEDMYAEWSREYREQLLRAYIQTLEEAAEAALDVGDARLAEALAGRAVAREPLRETGHILLIRGLAAVGDRAAALAAFDALRRALREELGVEPSPEATAIRQQVAAGHLDERPPEIRRSRASVTPEHQTQTLAFVGRRTELDALDRALDALDRSVVVVTGGAGSGKSRLLLEAGARSHLPRVAARAFHSEREDAWDLTRTLFREALALRPDAVRDVPDPAVCVLADLVPEIADLRPLRDSVIDAESRRALILEGGTRLMSAALGDRGAVFIDDLQWADSSSLELVAQVLRRGPVGLVLAYRPEELGAEHVVSDFVTGLTAVATVRRIELGPLSHEAIAELIADEDTARTIAQETDRTPLAVAEVLRLLESGGIIRADPHGRWRGVSPAAAERIRPIARAGQRAAIRARVDGLPPRCRTLLRLLALVGREITAAVMARALGSAEREVLEALDVLARVDLVHAGERGWAMRHEVIGEAVVERLRREERARLHAMLADALSLELDEPAAIARHQVLAGDPERAAASFTRGARAALDRFAHVEAGRLATEGLAIGPGRGPRAELLGVRAEVRARSGDLVAARDDLRAVLTLTDPGPARSRVLTRMARLASGSEDFAVAADLVELSLAEAAEDHRVRAEALTTGAIVAINLDRLERAEAYFEEALRLFERSGDARGAADILDGRAMSAWAAGRISEAAQAMDRVARLFRDAGELMRVGFPRASRGTLLHWMARSQEGLDDVDEALELERTLGNADGECYALCSRSGIMLGLSRVSDALADATEALRLAQRLRHREWNAYACWSMGQADLARGELAAAEEAFAAGLAAAHNMPIFASYNTSGMATALARRGDLDSARGRAQRALAEATPQTVFEARAAAAEVAVLAHDPDAERIIRQASEAAERSGHLLSLRRLNELAVRS